MSAGLWWSAEPDTYLVHNAENDLLIIRKTSGQLLPELLELLGCGGIGIGRASNDGARRWLLGRIIVSHVIMRVENGICTCKVSAGQ